MQFENNKKQIYESLFEIMREEDGEPKSGRVDTEDDKTFRGMTESELTQRDISYTNLLHHYVKITIRRNYLKEFFKWFFLIVVIASIICFIYMCVSLFNVYIKKATIEQLIKSIPVLITAIAGIVSVIITIPMTITKYLFSTKEDEYITQLILHTQEHDTSSREWTSKYIQQVEKETYEKDAEK